MSLPVLGVLDKAPPSRGTAWRRACSRGRSLGALATRIAYGSGTKPQPFLTATKHTPAGHSAGSPRRWASGSTSFVSSPRCTVVNWEPA